MTTGRRSVTHSSGRKPCGNHVVLQGFGLQRPDGTWAGLDIDLSDWACRIVKRVGMTEKASSPTSAPALLELKRGLNALASKGGLQYPYPIR